MTYKYIVVIIGLLLVSDLNSQRVDLRKKITVTGSAETSILPDEFEIEITLSENNSTYYKKPIGKIEEEFKNILNKHHIDIEKLKFTGQNNRWYYWWSNRHRSSTQKTYKITLDHETDLLAFVQDLDIKGVTRLNVSNSTNKKIYDLRQEVKTQAVQAAKNKAKYLLESIDEKLGGVIFIEEMPEASNLYWRNQQSAVSNVYVKSSSSAEGVGSLPEIKLRYEIRAVFEIQ